MPRHTPIYAHSTATPDGSDWQTLADHSAAVAALAREFAEAFGAGNAAALAGWLHDLGKYAEQFQRYIRGQSRSGGDHSTAGARKLRKLITARSADAVIADLLEYAIAGHHAGLPDRRGGPASLDQRLAGPVTSIDDIWRSELSPPTSGLWPAHFKAREGRMPSPFQLALLGRMLFSCLVDADFLDTESFFATATQTTIDRDWPRLAARIDDLIAAFDHYMDKKRRTAASNLNRLRGDILTHARRKAELAPGVFTLNVPTGGGKTLASLGFALDHAKRWGKTRIIYAIPFTSIIEQTAAIFREILGPDVLLEHHASIEMTTSFAEENTGQGTAAAKLRRAMENWQAPVVVTTNVQLFESLFASRTSRCRKLHNLANAVIILDEAQTIPLHVLRPCVVALDELARNYGCTIVLCTATQPALAAPAFDGGFALDPERELAPDPARLHRLLRRTTQRLAGEMTDAQLIEEIAACDRALVIVNSRQHALQLYQLASERGLTGLIHLTTRQTAADRRTILGEVRKRLTDEVCCRVIATSLIEAGVDVDFPRTWRAEAGLDQLAQAAGRTNREGKRPIEDSIVTIFKPAGARAPSEIRGLIGDTDRVLGPHKHDLFSPEAITAYFNEVYWRKGSKDAKETDGLDCIPIRNLDGQVVKGRALVQFSLTSGQTDFAYRSVGEAFRLIESGMASVIIAIDEEPRRTLAALRNGMPAGAAARALQRYIVQIPAHARQQLIDNGHVRFVDGFGDQFAELVTIDRYTRETGLVWEESDQIGQSQWLI
jgi:CRISPR-associated endonuclease/helicase Cas3